MSNYKSIPVSQWECGRKMANEKKIGCVRLQKSYDDGSFSRFLDGLKVESTAVTPPSGARVHIIRVKVKLDRPWQEAVNAAGPNTPSDYNVRKVDGLYQPTGAEEIEEDLILLNYPSGDGNWDKALAWAQGACLKNTAPREVFAIGEQHPKLHNQLGLNPMYVVATTECSFDGDRFACYVWWFDAGREANLRWVGHFGGARGWFAFRK